MDIFLIVFGLFGTAFFIEALVLYFFKLKMFWPSVGIAILINLVSITLVYFIGSFALSRIGYEFNGLQLDLPVVAFICWVSIIVEGLLLQVFCKTAEKQKIFLASILMNILSYSFLYFFITNSH